MHTDAAGIVGPNAILQTGSALRDLIGPHCERDVFARAGLARYLADPPHDMIRETEAMDLFASVRQHLAIDRADQLLAEAGARTARYVMENRIPLAVRRLLVILPAPLSSRILLTAIGKHAWTFAGSGVVRIERGPRLALSIESNPLATPGCPWHVATFEEMFRTLVSPRTRVAHESCCARGNPACTFSIRLR